MVHHHKSTMQEDSPREITSVNNSVSKPSETVRPEISGHAGRQASQEPREIKARVQVASLYKETAKIRKLSI